MVGSAEFSVRELFRKQANLVWEDGATFYEMLELKTTKGKEKIFAGQLKLRFKLEMIGKSEYVVSVIQAQQYYVL
jgi:hypothetical protein